MKINQLQNSQKIYLFLYRLSENKKYCLRMFVLINTDGNITTKTLIRFDVLWTKTKQKVVYIYSK